MKNKIEFQRIVFVWFSKNFETIKDKSFGTKTSFKNLLKTLVKMRNFALENLRRNKSKKPRFIGFPKYSRWAPEPGQNGLSVDCSVDQPIVRFLIVGVVGRSPQGNLPVGRPPGQLRPEPESELSGRSTGRSTARSTGPMTKALCTSCAHRSTARSTEIWSGQSIDRPLVVSSWVLGFWNLVF